MKLLRQKTPDMFDDDLRQPSRKLGDEPDARHERSDLLLEPATVNDPTGKLLNHRLGENPQAPPAGRRQASDHARPPAHFAHNVGNLADFICDLDDSFDV